MTSRSIAVVTTGGTIAMRYDVAAGGNMPALNGRELLDQLGPLPSEVALGLEEWERLPAVHRDAVGMWNLRTRIAELAADPGVAGVVVTHGTDTMAEMAYLLRRTVDTETPVVLTGAMRTASAEGSDGPCNLSDAITVANTEASRGRGAMVAMAGMIFDGAEVVKRHTEALDAFGAPRRGAMGTVRQGVVQFHHPPSPGGTISATGCDAPVALMVLALGDDGSLLDLVRPRSVGLVVAGYGRGNVPPGAMPAITRWLAEGKPVVLASQCPEGTVGADYAFEGGGRQVLALGVIPAGPRTAAQARLELALCLSAGVPYGTGTAG